MDLMFQPLRKYAQFSGRARRSEYWLWLLFVIGIQIVFQILIVATGGSMMSGAGGGQPSGLSMVLLLIFCAVMLGLLIPSLAVTFRRLHDTNRSAWWILIGLIPFIGALVLLVFYLLPGTPGPNNFGEDPKAAAGAEVMA
jgi:uncharacterized membrane protein YhaH (DUF805 family)